jgi:CRP/FNR family transcriptional regulator
VSQEYLAPIPLFYKLSKTEREKIASITDKKEFLKGDYIFKQGDLCGHLFIIEKGMVKITRAVRGNQVRTLEKHQSGEFFGGISFIDGKNYFASAICVLDSKIFIIDKVDFNELAKENPLLTIKILKTIIIYYCSTYRKIESKIQNMIKYLSGTH